MKGPIKIAIYSGEIPSTTFIERLISGVSETGKHILLFGAIKKTVQYPSHVKVIGYRNRKLSKLLHLLYYSLLLLLYKRGKKQKLDAILKKQGKNDFYTKVKYYPVLWHQPDIFHIQWAKGLKDWVWVSDFNMKLVLSLRGAHINYSPIADVELANMYRNNFPKVDRFHAVSNAIALEAQKYGAQSNAIQVVYSGLEEIKNTLSTQNYNQPFKILSVGRPHWKKGYAYALDACKLLKQSGVKFIYTIIGGAGDVELLYQINDLELEDSVVFLKQQPYLEVQKAMDSTDVLLLPSVEEGIANVVLEAMALGTMVLSTNCGGMAEVIEHHKNGFIVPIRNAEAIANTIINMQSLSSDECLKIRVEAQNTIMKQHTHDKMVSGMLNIYENVLAK